MEEHVLPRLIGSLVIAIIGAVFVPHAYMDFVGLAIAALLGEAAFLVLFGNRLTFPLTLLIGLVFGVAGGALGQWMLHAIGLPGITPLFGAGAYLHTNGALTTSGISGFPAAIWDFLVIGAGSLVIALPLKLLFV